MNNPHVLFLLAKAHQDALERQRRSVGRLRLADGDLPAGTRTR